MKSRLFDKILIANRGEIAIRIMRAAKALHIRTVAVYAEVDKDSWHVSFADEAYCLGEQELADTYLNVEKILDIASHAGADAIHPGYGFLSENPTLVEACEKNGIVFIGPDTRAIKLMGNKIESRAFVQDLKVPTTQGVTGDEKKLIAEAKKIPLPILVKAAAGGGGKGMRIVRDLKDLPEIIETTQREALSYFGDGTVFVEKYVEEPRHIEIQVMGDKHGNAIHLFERECSIQRRYQKIIEESPSPTLNDEVRQKMGEAAVKITKAIGYSNAGTIEFLVDKNLDFYFLEMNTRIQVEHPVTEMVTGVDLVQEQISVAAGNPLSFAQEDISQSGHAIECRVYAEDPANNFLPSPGQMIFYREPKNHRVRIDACTDKAATIHSFYDPMIAKVIVWENDREHARRKMIDVLKDYISHGIKTNIRFLIELLQEQNYINNTISTKFCDDHLDELVQASEEKRGNIVNDAPITAYVLYYLKFNEDAHKPDIWHQIGYWRDVIEFNLSMDDDDYEVMVYHLNKNLSRVVIRDREYIVETPHLTRNEVTIKSKEGIFRVIISHDNLGNAFVSVNGHIFNIHRDDLLIREDVYTGIDSPDGGGDGLIFTPMPGKVVKVNVKTGETVSKGSVLLIVEAMKMENNIVAPRDGKVEKVNVKAGNMVDGSRPLLVLAEGEI